VNRDDVFIWLSLFWFVTLCGLVIWMLLSTGLLAIATAGNGGRGRT